MKNKELKTLQELHDFYEENWRELNIDFIDFIKAEAIKDYKRYSNKANDGTECNDVALYIKWKNNLTESDLKEVNN